ncbi:hypothetical protein [Pelotalea chapellei]|uniref:Uncharacterized protein n=1 Tax=Pelotalea chapellei TaxID=44671 RepID=A0ABS5UAG4_9BACT|nr:hypothetical protein [Pelotalea chapellei]MBT1072657.1 hypothetical protein [Pelotalea chapellei]
MITRAKLPEDYKPLEKLCVCSNIMIGGGHLVAVGDVLPLLVGSGKVPMIWLEAPMDQTGKNYVPLVAASVALHPAVNVTSDGNALTVFVGGSQVLHVVQNEAEVAEIDILDLRPIGLNIFGNPDSMTVGGSTFSQNTFSGGGTFLSFGI